MKRAGLCATLLSAFAGTWLFACASSDAPRSTEPVVDAGSPNDANSQADDDADATDAARGPVEPAPRLAVSCTEAPCYVALSGNGSEHVCGLLDDGTVRCWGRDSRTGSGTPEADGALGRGRAVTPVEGATPDTVVGLHGVTQLSVGPNLGTCARTGDGSVYCWGRNEFGQLGRPSTDARFSTPVRVEGLPPVSFVALGATTACAIASDGGALWCWGSRQTWIGAIVDDGNESPAPSDDPTTFSPRVLEGFRPPVREISIGTSPGSWDTLPLGDTIAALLGDGTLATLGQYPAGGSSIRGAAPSPIPYEVPGVLRIGTFGYLAEDGLLSAWLPEFGRLRIPSPANVVDVLVAPGRELDPNVNGPYLEQAGVLLANGRLFRWGRNTAGSLGSPTNILDLAEQPLEVSDVAGSPVVSFATTPSSTCVSRVDGKVLCWGGNQRGELGRGSVDTAAHPEAELIR